MSDRRLDPTTLPGYRGTEYGNPSTPGRNAEYLSDGDNLVVNWTAAEWYDDSADADFILPLDILTEEQVIETLKRNGCPVP